MTRPDPQHRPTAAELAAQSHGQKPVQIGGKPAATCPYCGCSLFVNATETLQSRIERYVYCRNPKCGKRFFTVQQPATIVREVGADEFPSNGEGRLTLVRDTA